MIVLEDWCPQSILLRLINALRAPIVSNILNSRFAAYERISASFQTGINAKNSDRRTFLAAWGNHPRPTERLFPYHTKGKGSVVRVASAEYDGVAFCCQHERQGQGVAIHGPKTGVLSPIRLHVASRKRKAYRFRPKTRQVA